MYLRPGNALYTGKMWRGTRRETTLPDKPDAALEEELRQIIARADAVPPRLLQAAVDAFGWRSIDAELASLAFDSLAASGAPVRGPHPGRLLSFEADGLTIDLEITGTGPARALTGQIVPPARAAIDIRQADGVTALETDDLGRFRSEALGPGPFSLRCRTDGRQVTTDWMAI